MSNVIKRRRTVERIAEPIKMRLVVPIESPEGFDEDATISQFGNDFYLEKNTEILLSDEEARSMAVVIRDMLETNGELVMGFDEMNIATAYEITSYLAESMEIRLDKEKGIIFYAV